MAYKANNSFPCTWGLSSDGLLEPSDYPKKKKTLKSFVLQVFKSVLPDLVICVCACVCVCVLTRIPAGNV